MRLATLAQGGRDGTLVILSADNMRYLIVGQTAHTLQAALDNWADIYSIFVELTERLAQGDGAPITGRHLAAPLPRAWQWLDGSAFPSHGALMDKVLGITKEPSPLPYMYQGLSDHFLGPNDDVAFPDESLGIDFEGEFGVITDEVPMGTNAAEAMAHIKLIVQLNDWSLRILAGPEMRTGFGWVQAKPACSMAPIAVTPDELGSSWVDGRVHLNLAVDWNNRRFGNAHGGAMQYGFHELIAHAARTRTLCAGTIIGSGTVSNENFRDVGSSCIAERRGIEVIDEGQPRTEFMKFGDTVRMEARAQDDSPLFGAIAQTVVKS